MQSLWTELLAALRQPEYLHVLLHPLPIYGLAAGVLSLVLAVVFRNRGAQAIALVLIVLTAASAWLVAHYGHAAYDRVYAPPRPSPPSRSPPCGSIPACTAPRSGSPWSRR